MLFIETNKSLNRSTCVFLFSFHSFFIPFSSGQGLEDANPLCRNGDSTRMDRQRANVGMNRPWNTCWSAPSCHNPVPMKTWKSSNPELDPAPSIGRESCSDSRRRRSPFPSFGIARIFLDFSSFCSLRVTSSTFNPTLIMHLIFRPFFCPSFPIFPGPKTIKKSRLVLNSQSVLRNDVTLYALADWVCVFLYSLGPRCWCPWHSSLHISFQTLHMPINFSLFSIILLAICDTFPLLILSFFIYSTHPHLVDV